MYLVFNILQASVGDIEILPALLCDHFSGLKSLSDMNGDKKNLSFKKQLEIKQVLTFQRKFYIKNKTICKKH